VLAPCGFPPERTLAELPALTARPGWSSLPAVRSGRVWVVDGPAYLNRPGPRVVRGVEVLAHRAARSRDDRFRGGGFCHTRALASRA
jgi:iron complex transport system substrate-binding protein